MNESAFSHLIEEALGKGLTLERMMALILQRWKSEGNVDQIGLVAGTTKHDNKAVVEIKWGPLRAVVDAQGARSYGLLMLMCAEAAETNEFLIDYFATGKDQVLARKLADHMLPKLNEFRSTKIKEATGQKIVGIN